MHRILLVAAALSSCLAVEQLKVTVYDGPTKCKDVDKVKHGDLCACGSRSTSLAAMNNTAQS